MSSTRYAPPSARIPEAPVIASRIARAHLEAIVAGAAPHRVIVIGTAGSGKSRTLRRLRRLLAEAGTKVALTTGAADIRTLSSTDVLFVDDAHLLDEAQLAAVADRIDDVEAAVIVASRPWPQSEALARICAALERTQPPIVLGHVSRSDVLAHLESGDAQMPPDCVDDILELSGGVSWLVAESLAIHDSIDCSDDRRHAAIRGALEDVIAHRLRAIDPAERELVENLSLAAEGVGAPAGRSDLLHAGYSDGLLLRNGQPVPVVRSAVRSTIPVERLVNLYAASSVHSPDEAVLRGLLGGLRDPRVAAALLQHADALAQTDAARAADLYRAAAQAGADATTVAIRQAQVEWSRGDVEAASALLDAVPISIDHPEYDHAADTAAAIWAARGLVAMSGRVYRSFESSCPESSARASIAALALADRETLLATTPPPPGRTMPSTLAVSMDLLTRGMRETLIGSAHGALAELIRASEMYSSSGSNGPVPELPAVIAAIVAINLGELDVAHSVLDAALHEDHGGRWAHDRLVLWRAWVSLQQEHAQDVETAVQAILPTARSLSPRDKLLFDSISIAIARRYHDMPALVTAWRGARESLLRARFDLFSFLPLGEFVLTAARVGDTDRLQPHFAEALGQMTRLGSPPVWSAHLHWTGIQQAILLGRPKDLAPHARALVDAAPHNRLAATMAQAGRVWTSVLAGSVDADQVEKAALGLATVGLAWDGARLAGHAAARSDDRRVISRLLACARRLHPREDMRPTAVEEETPTPKSRSHMELSPREREVAALVIEGMTYAEIGSSIFISPRTAEHHIARIRRRLGATTRSDLIAKLRLVIDDEANDHGVSADVERASA